MLRSRTGQKTIRTEASPTSQFPPTRSLAVANQSSQHVARDLLNCCVVVEVAAYVAARGFGGFAPVLTQARFRGHVKLHFLIQLAILMRAL